MNSTPSHGGQGAAAGRGCIPLFGDSSIPLEQGGDTNLEGHLGRRPSPRPLPVQVLWLEVATTSSQGPSCPARVRQERGYLRVGEERGWRWQGRSGVEPQFRLCLPTSCHQVQGWASLGLSIPLTEEGNYLELSGSHELGT